MAVVLDEYGGVTGILTINDLIEQLVGDLGEDEEEHTVEQLEENVWKISGGIPLEEVSEQLGISLSCEEYDTFSGLIFHHLQSIPEDGTDVEIEFSGLKIRVTEIEDHQVKTAIVQKTEK